MIVTPFEHNSENLWTGKKLNITCKTPLSIYFTYSIITTAECYLSIFNLQFLLFNLDLRDSILQQKGD